MKTHFDDHLNIRKFMFERRPKVVVECGAGKGECTQLLSHMMTNYPFELHVISDKRIEGLDDRIQWHVGLSYEELPKFEDDSIDMCIIDTDHNYWTLKQELEAVDKKLKEGSILMLHDVDEFYHNTGMAMSYWNDSPYPKDKIMEYALCGGLGDCIIEFLSRFREKYKLIKWVSESYGACAIEKKLIDQIAIITPGDNPAFAKPAINDQDPYDGVLIS